MQTTHGKQVFAHTPLAAKPDTHDTTIQTRRDILPEFAAAVNHRAVDRETREIKVPSDSITLRLAIRTSKLSCFHRVTRQPGLATRTVSYTENDGTS